MKFRAESLALLLVLGCQAPRPLPRPERRPEPVLIRAEAIPVDATIPEDPGVLAALAPIQARMKAEFGRELCQAPQGLFRGRQGEDENLMGYWIADVMRERASAALGRPVPVALTNSGGVRANLRPGAVTVGAVFEVAPFENELVVVELTGSQLARAIRQGLERRAGEPCSGVKASVAGTPEHPLFELRWADGRPVDPAERILVATNDYLAANGDTMAGLKGSTPIETHVSIRQLLLDACEALGKAGRPLDPPAGGRYVVAPELAPLLRAQKLKLGDRP
ncbi:MAG TPA: 5'-nucleotidase C-terminal domain-containing protein [Holophagaceae bacterium]|nr:5'-nucleotidase C-terminal domain-containing protein [Holophagaceae bacterium]